MLAGGVMRLPHGFEAVDNLFTSSQGKSKVDRIGRVYFA